MLSRIVVRNRGSLFVFAARGRSFQSRAHPIPKPEYSVARAVQLVLDQVEERKQKRAQKWERNAPKRVEKGIEVSARECDNMYVCFCAMYLTVPFSLLRMTVRIEIKMKRLNSH